MTVRSRLPLVLVPALGSDERLWNAVAEMLSGETGRECIIVRGEGNSIDELADSVLAKAPQTFDLAGISMGGYVSLDIALRHTHRVRGLVLLNTSAIAASPQRREAAATAIDAVNGGHFEETVQMVSAAVAPTRPDVADLAAAMARDLGPRVFIDQQMAVSTRRDRRGELRELDVPTLVIAGADDTITPSSLSAELAAGLPRSELIVLDGVGHLSVVEQPRQVADALSTWLDRLDGVE